MNPLDPAAERVRGLPRRRAAARPRPAALPRRRARTARRARAGSAAHGRLRRRVQPQARGPGGAAGRPLGPDRGVVVAVLLTGAGLCAWRAPWGALLLAAGLHALAVTLYRLRGDPAAVPVLGRRAGAAVRRGHSRPGASRGCCRTGSAWRVLTLSACSSSWPASCWCCGDGTSTPRPSSATPGT